MRLALTLGLVALTLSPSLAQSVTYSGSLRVRQEGWDWFKPANGSFQNAYTFTGATLRYGATRATLRDEAVLEVEAPALFGLPSRASAPAPQGGLGLGSLYRSFNGKQTRSLFLKQAYYKDKGLGLRVGRFELSDGAETTPSDPALASVKAQRVAQRLIGPFGWTHVGRSFDGAHYSKTQNGTNLTVAAASPTRGVFDLDGQTTLSKVRFGYVAATQSTKTEDRRLFALSYEDARPGIAKVDNRPTADTRPVRLTTVGGHWLKARDTERGKWDYLAWAAYQTGDWGSLSHRAYSYALEAGFQPKDMKNRPWLRVGYNVGSGDASSGDGKHGTFYPILNTPRIYARTPFYGESNVRDAFVSLSVKTLKQTSIRADWHRVSLDKAADRWYSAGGPFEPTGSFGLVGRGNPSGKTALADLVDISVDQAIDKRTVATLYAGQMLGKSVVRAIYPDKNGLFVYAELSYKL